MSLFSRKTWNITMVMIVFVVVLLIITARLGSNMNYKAFDISSPVRNPTAFNGPLLSLAIKGILDSVTFHDVTNQIRSRSILEIRGSELQLGKDHFFVRGFKRFEKPFLQRVFSKFDYWYMVFEIEYLSNETMIRSEWFDGTDRTPVIIQNYKPYPTEEVKQEGDETFRKIEEIFNSYVQSPIVLP